MKSSLAYKFAVVAAGLIVVPMAIVYLLIRQQVTASLSEQYEANAEALIRSIRSDVGLQNAGVALRLAALRNLLGADTGFRGEISRAAPSRTLVDFAGERMALMGLDALSLCAADGTILSSGHYRAEFGANEADRLRRLIDAGNGPTLFREHRPQGPFWALERVDSLTVSGKRLYLIGGVEIGSDFLRRLQKGTAAGIALVAASDTLAAAGIKQAPASGMEFTMGRFEIPLVSSDGVASAEFRVFIPRSPLHRLISNLNRSMLWIVFATVLIAALVGAWLSRQITRPLRQLTDQVEAITLYPLDLPFRVQSRDEVGQLSRAFRRMIYRLRRERLNLQAAEQQATLAEVARQVNHDIKNGFLPIRNVMRHWERIAGENPRRLAEVFVERKATIFESLAYLESLARSYAGLKPKMELRRVDLNELVSEIALLYRDLDPNIDVRSELQPSLRPVRVDAVQMRRVVENVLRNAVEALEGRGGEVCLRSHETDHGVVLEISDNGPGMPAEVQQRVFEGFYSTKGGSGLGLLNARRIVQDFGGRLRIDTAPGKGTTVSIELPAEGGG